MNQILLSVILHIVGQLLNWLFGFMDGQSQWGTVEIKTQTTI